MGRVAQALQELREGLPSDPPALRRRIAELVGEVAEAPIGIWYVFGLVEGVPLPVDWTMVGASDAAFRRWLDEAHEWPGGDPRLPDRQSGRFVTMGSVFDGDALAQSSLYQRCIAPLGISDQIRMMAYFRHRHIGWVGAMRSRGDPPFGSRELRRLRQLTPAITSALVRADVTARADPGQEPCDLVISTAGDVELASETAGPVLSHPERTAMIAAWARAAERGETPPPVLAGLRAHWSRLVGTRGSSSYYLVHLEPLEPLRVSPTFELSKAQRRIAEYAALGARVREIAEWTGLAPTTVRTHLRAVYERLGVGTRVELARVLDHAELEAAATGRLELGS